MLKFQMFKKPKNLGIKIVSQEEALWTKVRDGRIAAIKQLEESLIIEKAVLEMCEAKIKQEQSK